MSVTVNGKTYDGNNVTITNNRVIIDGVDVTNEDMPKAILQIEVKGTLASLNTDASVNCDSVAGDVHAGGSVNCDDIKGNVSAGGSVNADDIGGSVNAGGSVRHG